MSAPPTLRVAEELLTYAREHERQARFWRKTARRQRLGWDTWGNEALEHVTIGAAGAPTE